MRELSIQLNVYPIAKMRQDIYRFIADEFTFSPVPEDSEAGRCYNCNKEITVDLPPADVIRDFFFGQVCHYRISGYPVPEVQYWG